MPSTLVSSWLMLLGNKMHTKPSRNPEHPASRGEAPFITGLFLSLASYESRLLLALLLTPCLAHADAFGALGYAQTVAGLLVLGILILVGVGAVLVRRPR